MFNVICLTLAAVALVVSGAPSAPTAFAQTATDQRPGSEAEYWRSIVNSTDPEDFRTYLRKYPEGEFAALARNRLERLEAAPTDELTEDPDREVTALRASADADPKNVEKQMLAAAALGRRDDFDGALVYLERAFDLLPDDYDLLVIVASAKFDVGRYEDAKRLYQRAIAIRPDDVEVSTDLGTTFVHLGDFDNAIVWFRYSLKLDPKQENALQNLAMALVTVERPDEAGAIVERLAAVNPKNEALTWLHAELRKLRAAKPR